MKVPNRSVGLHSHDGFSTFDGLGYPQEHIDFVRENGMDAWCLTNHGHMNSFAHAYLYVEKLNKAGANFKFIPGCEMYVHPDLDVWQLDREIHMAAKKGNKEAIHKLKAQREAIATPLTAYTDSDDEISDVKIAEDDAGLTIENEEETKSSKFYDPLKRRHHLVVLPKSSEGLRRLFHLVSRGYSEGFYRFPRVDYKMLKEAASGGHLMISSACLTADVELITDQGLQELGVIIDRLKDDDDVMVLSYNENTGEQEFKKVLWGDMTRKNAKLLRVKLADGKSVTLTPDHKVFTNEGWVEAQDLKGRPGIKILTV
jgi:DNA polymerase III alpha subunit